MSTPTSQSSDAAPVTAAPIQVGAGRGLLFITGAKLWFMVAGYVIQFALPRVLSVSAFGLWILVLSLISPVNNVVVTATIQGVSKFVAESATRAPSVVKAALELQLYLGLALTVGFVGFAPAVAWFEHDPTLVTPVRIASVVVASYALYAVFVGSANGSRAFHKQAALDASFSTLRAFLVVGVAGVTGSAVAAVGGFGAAAACILALSVIVVGWPRTAPGAAPFSQRTLAQFFGGVALYLLILNLLMFVDSILLKRLCAEAAIGLHVDPKLYSDTQEAYYGAAQAIARIPYQLILAVTFIIFPLVSASTFARDVDKTRRYIAVTMRYSLVVVALLGATLGARPQAMLHLLYPSAGYSIGAPALAVLLVGYVGFSLLTIAGTIINGSGRTGPTVRLGVVTLSWAVLANWIAIGVTLAHHGDVLLAAAAATASAMLLGFVLSGLYLRRAFGVFLPLLTVARVALCTAAAALVGRVWPTHGFLGGKVGTLLSLCVIGSMFLAVAVISGELRPAELRRQRSLLSA